MYFFRKGIGSSVASVAFLSQILKNPVIDRALRNYANFEINQSRIIQASNLLRKLSLKVAALS